MRIRQTPIPIRKLHQLRHPQKQVRSMQLITGILPRRMPCQIPHHQVLPSLPIQITIHQSPISHRQLFIMPKSQLTKPQQMRQALCEALISRWNPDFPIRSYGFRMNQWKIRYLHLHGLRSSLLLHHPLIA